MAACPSPKSIRALSTRYERMESKGIGPYPVPVK